MNTICVSFSTRSEMKYKLNNEDIQAITKIQKEVSDNSSKLEAIIDDIIKPYVSDLDSYVSFISDCLKDGTQPPTDAELEDFCLNLSTYIYWAGGMCEYLGIKDDISKAIYKEVYHSVRSELDKGTVADKDSIAELNSREEMIVNICYSRASKIVKSKVENAQEILSSCKKVLTRRMNEYNLTQQIGGK